MAHMAWVATHYTVLVIFPQIMSNQMPAAQCGIRPTARSAPRLSSALRAPPLCRCAERTADLVWQRGWSAVCQTRPPLRGPISCRGEVKEEAVGRGTRAAATGRPSRLASSGPWSLRLSLLLALVCGAATAAAAPTSVFLEELTSPEVSEAIRGGSTTIILPVGGTEQNGPHMALGKHNVRARVLSGRIAQSLGHTLVAPVLPYVPEGNITPPTEHMRFAGTISVPEAAFKSILDAAARGFKQHGFRDVVILGDSGNYQGALKTVVARLNHDWAASGVRAHYLGTYYNATQTTYIAALKAQGLTDAQIGTHAGTADTALSMALEPSLVKPGLLAEAARAGRAGGAYGDPRAATPALGQLGVDAVVQQSVAAIRQAVLATR